MKKTLTLLAIAATSLIFSASGIAADKESTSQKDEKTVIELNKKAFLEKIVNYEKNPDKWIFLGDKPAIIDFYATWCVPCKRLAPILEELSKDYEGKVDFYRIDAEKERELSGAFNIQFYPTLIFIPKDGTPQSLGGLRSKEELKTIIDQTFFSK